MTERRYITPALDARLDAMLEDFEHRKPGAVPLRGQQRFRQDAYRRFELKDALTPGSNATAHPIKSDDSTDETAASEFEVYDPYGKHRGRAKDAYSSPHDDGSKGLARYNPLTQQWEIVELQPAALMIKGQLKSALVAASGTFDVDNVSVMQPIGGLITDTDPASSSFTITNRSFDGDDNAWVYALWDEAARAWVAFDIPCPA